MEESLDVLVPSLSRGRGVRLPAHCRGEPKRTPEVDEMRRLLRSHDLHSVCEQARCPNLRHCFGERTVSFMLLGPICTRACRFCAVATGRPGPVDEEEPERVAAAVESLALRHVVLTSVNRDDLPDQGALQFARTIRAVRERAPTTTIEVLTPDFRGSPECIERVARAAPDVYNHNMETVPRLYRRVRPGAVYERSLGLLARVKEGCAGIFTKSGMMLGLGEEREEVLAVLADLRASGVDAVTLGQYLRPTLRHLPVHRYLAPAEFDSLRRDAEALGFRYVASSPLVRSSFHADQARMALQGTTES